MLFFDTAVSVLLHLFFPFSALCCRHPQDTVQINICCAMLNCARFSALLFSEDFLSSDKVLQSSLIDVFQIITLISTII